MQARREARAIARLRSKPSESFSEIFSNPSLGSVDPSTHSSVCARLGLMAEHSGPGFRQVRHIFNMIFSTSTFHSVSVQARSGVNVGWERLA